MKLHINIRDTPWGVIFEAWDDDLYPDCPIGRGATAQDAIDDLELQIEEMEE